MFYTIDHLTTAEQETFESTYAAMIAAEESGSLDNDTLNRVDDLLALAAACDAGYAQPLIQESWEHLT